MDVPQTTKPEPDQDKPLDEYQAASRATAEYEEYSKHAAAYSAPRHRVRKLLIIMGILLLLAAIGFGVYWLFMKDSGNKTTDDSGTTQNDSQQSPEPEARAGITTKTEHYVSNMFMLEFDHPEDWTVTETTGSGQVTVQSPALQLESPTGEPTAGRVLLRIRNKQQPLPEFDAGNAVAARESEKIAYTKPSSVQRGSTYLSFLRYASSSPGGLDGVYITGDIGYQAEQAIPKADFVPVDPVISITFVRCAGSDCADAGTAMPISVDLWAEAEFGRPLKAMLQSLTIN
jgi:hypothetical protein